MQPYGFISRFDGNNVSYEEGSSSSSLADVSDEPKEDDDSESDRDRNLNHNALRAIVCHRNSHCNLAWCPIPQPRCTGSPLGGGGGMVVRCSKKHKWELKVLCTHEKLTHHARTAWCTARTALTFAS